MSNNSDLIMNQSPLSDNLLPFLKVSRSAPTTPRNQEEDNTSYQTPPRLFSNEEEQALSKEMQISMLKERLEFTEKQLQEKDRQLDHYKQLVRTLKDVLAEVSGRRFSGVRPPPGFEQQPQTPQPKTKYQIKGRKVRSFHNDYYQPDDDEDEQENIEKEKSTIPAWRKHSTDENHPVETTSLKKEVKIDLPSTQREAKELITPRDITPHGNMEDQDQSSREPSTRENILDSNHEVKKGFRISKSVSHTALSTLVEDAQPVPTRESLQHPSLRASTGSQSKVIEQVVGASPSSTRKSLGALKKSQSMTSVYSVLEENRLDSKFPDLDQMVGQIYALSKYQQGCRFLQKKLDDKNSKNTQIILNELSEHLVELMIDPFGNYLFSKLMEHCNDDQKQMVVNKILPDLMTTAFDMYGTQSLQKMMPFLQESQINSVVSILKANAISLIKHNKANYLIQYCLDNLPQKHNQWIYDAVVESIEEVSRDRVGCVIVKRCIDHANEEQKARLGEGVTNKALALVQDPFGNYVVQHILDKFSTEEQSLRLIRNLLGSITDLCTQKFSSNVVEKCLKVADGLTRASMLLEIIESEILPQLLNDRFANFVIQTALDVAEPEQRQALVKNILPHLGRHYSPYTKRLQKKILQV